VSAPVLEARGLTKHFPLRGGFFAQLLGQATRLVRAVEGVDFALGEGEVLGVVGESGCGKSTLGMTVVRLYEPTAGEVRFLGEDVAHYRGRRLRAFRRHAQIIFQDPYQSLNPRFTVFDAVREPLVIHGLASSATLVDRVVETLDQVGLRPPETFCARFPHELSGGQRQRVAIARAMVVRPRFVVADEPVSMLDVSIRAGILKLLRRFTRDAGLSLLYISHDISTVRYLCDRTAVMYLGRIVEFGPTESVLARPRHPYTRALLAAVPLPDPDSGRARVRLPGEVPSSVSRPPGCAFHPRCPEVFEPCAALAPRLVPDGTSRAVACHLHASGIEAAALRTGTAGGVADAAISPGAGQRAAAEGAGTAKPVGPGRRRGDPPTP
jgi:oligopeptide/dipeptide ABC transporter ATP-binding protein